MSLLVENRTSIQVIQSTRVLRAFRFVINQPLTKPKKHCYTQNISIHICFWGGDPSTLPSYFPPKRIREALGRSWSIPQVPWLAGFASGRGQLEFRIRQWDSNFHQVKSQRSSPPYLHHIPFPWGFSHKPSLLQHLNFSSPLSLTT